VKSRKRGSVAGLDTRWSGAGSRRLLGESANLVEVGPQLGEAGIHVFAELSKPGIDSPKPCVGGGEPRVDRGKPSVHFAPQAVDALVDAVDETAVESQSAQNGDDKAGEECPELSPGYGGVPSEYAIRPPAGSGSPGLEERMIAVFWEPLLASAISHPSGILSLPIFRHCSRPLRNTRRAYCMLHPSRSGLSST
jgi:hypothetical protein